MTRIGLVGLGRMGLPVFARLVDAGFEVSATDARPELRAQVSPRWSDSPTEAAAGVQLLITMLPGTAEVAGVIDELAGALAPGACWIEMSSAAPHVARSIALACSPRGVRFIDAPVGGDPDAATDGALVVFVGGEAADVEVGRPALEALAETIVHVGPSGSGYAAKLLVNALWFTQATASAEVLTLGRRLGLDPDALLGALRQSAADSRFLSDSANRLLDGADLTSFPLARCCEHLSTVVGLAAGLEVPLDVISTVSELYGSALERYGAVDGELLGARLVAERANVSLRRD
jgi:3-hydroxyisobutyrate dehydrogenase